MSPMPKRLTDGRSKTPPVVGRSGSNGNFAAAGAAAGGEPSTAAGAAKVRNRSEVRPPPFAMLATIVDEKENERSSNVVFIQDLEEDLVERLQSSKETGV